MKITKILDPEMYGTTSDEEFGIGGEDITCDPVSGEKVRVDSGRFAQLKLVLIRLASNVYKPSSIMGIRIRGARGTSE